MPQNFPRPTIHDNVLEYLFFVRQTWGETLQEKQDPGGLTPGQRLFQDISAISVAIFKHPFQSAEVRQTYRRNT